jgi:hypothetical protein
MHEGTPRTRAAGDGARARPLATPLPEDEPTVH